MVKCHQQVLSVQEGAYVGYETVSSQQGSALTTLTLLWVIFARWVGLPTCQSPDITMKFSREGKGAELCNQLIGGACKAPLQILNQGDACYDTASRI